MNPIFSLFALALVVAQFVVPRRLIFAPLLIAAFNLPYQEGISFAGANFTAVRLLIVAGLLRGAAGGAVVWSPRNSMDRLMAVFACTAVFTSLFHESNESFNPVTVSVGMAFDYMGVYLFSRAYLTSEPDLAAFCKCLGLALFPLAVLLTMEKLTGSNIYSSWGALIEEAWVRDGRVRATGPFGVAILAGTAGASNLPLVAVIYSRHRKWAIVAIVACVLIVFCSASSGPVMTLLASLGGLTLWRWRKSMRWVVRGALLFIAALALVMNAPVWYLIARIDFAGGSTSWHRAELITQAVNHLNEWWLVGTDYTRHWMPYGIQWSSDQSDITNYYVNMGVRGGLPLLIAFVLLQITTFQWLGRTMRALRETGDPAEWSLWCLGTALFAHCVSFLGISYFDQSTVFLCLIFGATPGLCAATDLCSTLSARSERSDDRLDPLREPQSSFLN